MWYHVPNKIQSLLNKYHKDVWVMYQRECSDKYFNKYIASSLDTNSIAIVTPKYIFLLVHQLDAQNLSSLKLKREDVTVYEYNSEKELMSLIEEIIAFLKFPKEIALSYSTLSDSNTDILTHGKYMYLTKLLRNPYHTYHKKVKFCSAEHILYALESEKSEDELKRLKKLVEITNRILEETFRHIKVGTSEIEIRNLTQMITNQVMQQEIEKNEIISFDVAWKNAPIVLVGENLAKGGHTEPSDKVLKEGETIYFDFGIKAEFVDGMVLYTDMQRMGYALGKKETKPPKSVQKVFQTLVDSIEECLDDMKPGVKGYQIDKKARDIILNAGYPDYYHATGHPVGREVHDMGALISIKSSKRANFSLIENGVYTLEPRINIVNGGSIEEMIQVTKFGGIPLGKLQKELYVIKN